MISIHALVKRATLVSLWKRKTDTISIHALVKRATIANQQLKQSIDISIHALVKRATSSSFSKCRSYLFQSTPS